MKLQQGGALLLRRREIAALMFCHVIVADSLLRSLVLKKWTALLRPNHAKFKRSSNFEAVTCTDASLPYQHCWAKVDYSAALEYIESHYPQAVETDEKGTSFFSTYEDFVSEPVYDARWGVLHEGGSMENRSLLVPASFDECGFTLEDVPSAVHDWSNLREVEGTYLSELAHGALGALQSPPGSRISHIAFWHPNLRDTQYEQNAPPTEDEVNGRTQPTLSAAPIASMVHIDTDFNGFAGSLDELVSFIERNSFGPTLKVKSRNKNNYNPEMAWMTKFPCEEITDALKKGRRFAVINAWRNVGCTTKAHNDTINTVAAASSEISTNKIVFAPLAILSQRALPRPGSNFDANDQGTNLVTREIRHYARFPLRARGVDGKALTGQWYRFPRMTTAEVLFFAQFDRDIRRPSDLWHCALPTLSEVTESCGIGAVSSNPSQDRNCGRRRSFELRMFVVYHEVVPAHLDRFLNLSNDLMEIQKSDSNKNLHVPRFTRRESELFCKSQADARC